MTTTLTPAEARYAAQALRHVYAYPADAELHVRIIFKLETIAEGERTP